MSSLAADLPLGIRPGQSCHYDPELVRVRNWDQGQVIVLLCRGQYTWRHPPTSPLRSASKWPMRSVPKRPIKYVSNIIQVANEVRIQVADGYPGGHLSPTGTQVCSSCSLSPARVKFTAAPMYLCAQADQRPPKLVLVYPGCVPGSIQACANLSSQRANTVTSSQTGLTKSIDEIIINCVD